MITNEEKKTMQSIADAIDSEYESAMIVAVSSQGTRVMLCGGEPEVKKLKKRILSWLGMEARQEGEEL